MMRGGGQRKKESRWRQTTKISFRYLLVKSFSFFPTGRGLVGVVGIVGLGHLVRRRLVIVLVRVVLSVARLLLFARLDVVVRRVLRVLVLDVDPVLVVKQKEKKRKEKNVSDGV